MVVGRIRVYRERDDELEYLGDPDDTPVGEFDVFDPHGAVREFRRLRLPVPWAAWWRMSIAGSTWEDRRRRLSRTPSATVPTAVSRLWVRWRYRRQARRDSRTSEAA